MPRAVTRAISTSFATRTNSQNSTGDQSSAKATSTSEMFPSPRPSKASHHLSKRSAPPTSSPLSRGNFISSSPVTPPRALSSKRKKLNDAPLPVKAVVEMPEKLIKTYLDNYDLEVSDRIRRANQALQISIESARAQMMASISAYPRHILAMRVEDYLEPPQPPPIPTSKDSSKKRSSSQSIPPPHSHKTPRIARAGEIVYSARGSPILIAPITKKAAAVESSEEEEENEPSFDTASDKSSSSESFSLPDEAAYTAQVMEQERNRILSSEGFFPRSSSMYHRSSGS